MPLDSLKGCGKWRSKLQSPANYRLLKHRLQLIKLWSFDFWNMLI